MIPETVLSTDRQLEYLTVVNSGNSRKWKIIALILAVICFILIVILILTLLDRFYSSKSTAESISNTTDVISNSTATGFIDANTTLSSDQTTKTSKKYSPNVISSVLTTTITDIIGTYISYNLTGPYQYEIFYGLSLGNSLYYNIGCSSMSQGYISSVSFRLFTQWEGNELLYLFIISNKFLDQQILRRYSIIPERNTTTWQTINTLSYKIPIFMSNYLGIGMQDSSNTNKIYAINTKPAVVEVNIHNYTIHISQNFTKNFVGVAFNYIVFQNAETDKMTQWFVG